MHFIIDLLLTGLAVFLASYIIPGAEVSGFWAAVLAGFLIGLVNATLGTILRIFTLPLNILTLGLVSFIITVLMVMLVSNIMSGFTVTGFFPAVFFAIMTAIIQIVLDRLFFKAR